MYIVECSYDYKEFVNPWSVQLIDSLLRKTVEKTRVKSDDDVIKMVKSYKEIYSDKMITAEKVYMQGPRLDLVHIYD